MKTKCLSLALLALALLTMTGCFATGMDELYSLPQASEEYLRLESLIKLELGAGFEYASPTSGGNRQPVLLYDLDSDGGDEALAFLRGEGQLLKICIYDAPNGYDYAHVATIEGEGTAIRRVDFANLDGEGMPEMIVSWQISAEMRMLKVYSLEDWSGTEILTITECTEFRIADMSGDGSDNLAVLRFSSERWGVDVFVHDNENMLAPVSERLSAGFDTVVRMRTGLVSEGLTGLFVEGTLGDGRTVTDLFVLVNGRLINLADSDSDGINDTIRDYAVYAADIDNDRCMELPYTRRLYSQVEGHPGYLIFDWYGFDGGSMRKHELSTYHCYSDGWLITVPPEWRDNLTVRREDRLSGERVVVFSCYDEMSDTVTDLLTIYKLTGENRFDRSRLAVRFELLSDDSTIYAAKINYEGNRAAIPMFSQQEVQRWFSLIYTEWNPGTI